MSPRYQARMVSGLAAPATFSRALRPSRLPISASVHRSGSDRRSRGGKCARRTRFSAAKYSFWRSSSWFTSPVTYANRRAQRLPFILTVHHRRSPIFGLFEYFDHSGLWRLLRKPHFQHHQSEQFRCVETKAFLTRDPEQGLRWLCTSTG